MDSDLTMQKFKEIWIEFSKMPNPSHLIKPLNEKIGYALLKSPEKVISVSDLRGILTDFDNSKVISKLPICKDFSFLTEMQGIEKYKNFKYDSITNIVFEEHPVHSYVAIGLFTSNKIFELQDGQVQLCINKGWYFKSNDPDINCPFKINN